MHGQREVTRGVHYITYWPSTHSRGSKYTIIVSDISVKEIVVGIMFYQLATQEPQFMPQLYSEMKKFLFSLQVARNYITCMVT
jgi:hypothetical protein